MWFCLTSFVVLKVLFPSADCFTFKIDGDGTIGVFLLLNNAKDEFQKELIFFRFLETNSNYLFGF